MLDAGEKTTLDDLGRLAQRLELQAYNIRCAIEYSKRNETTRGLADMVAYSFNAQQHSPEYGGGGGGLPVGMYKGVIVKTEAVDTRDAGGNVKGGYLAFHLTPIEGPLVGQTQIDRLNLHHMNPKTVEIANKQLSAYCHVTGKYQFNDTDELCNIPFCFEVGYQKGHEPSAEKPNGGYTEVKRLADINGNEPGKAVAAAPVAAPVAPPAAAPAAGVQATGAWGGAPATPAANPAPAAAPAAGGAWGGAPAAAAPAPAAGGGWGQGAPASGAPAGWGPR